MYAKLCQNPVLYKTIILIAVFIIMYVGYSLFIADKSRLIHADKFSNITLNDVSLPSTTPPNLKAALDNYDCYFNAATRANIMAGANRANTLLTDNHTKNQDNLLTMYNQIDTKLDELNYNLITQIEKNYYDAHLLNVAREQNKTSLSQLPLSI
jgi:hypothetical protein